jgi:chitosanase
MKHFPSGVLEQLFKTTGLDDEEAWSNIMGLSCKPEQDSLRWWEFYGYAEALDYDRDLRGVTIGFAGFTTHNGNQPGDAFALFSAYQRRGGKDLRPLVNKTESLIAVIKKLANDPRWQAAQWECFIATYVTDTAVLLKERGFSRPLALTLGAVLDCAFNQGSDGEAGMRSLAKCVPPLRDERKFLQHFLTERAKVAGTRAFNSPPINGINRVKQYQELLKASEMDLKNCDALIRRVTSWKLE